MIPTIVCEDLSSVSNDEIRQEGTSQFIAKLEGCFTEMGEGSHRPISKSARV